MIYRKLFPNHHLINGYNMYGRGLKINERLNPHIENSSRVYVLKAKKEIHLSPNSHNI
jgi:hypothetical protein